ncbi:MAG: hypothetical protein JXR96_02325 [Deltaproteobacteria bacterium]|nr:hypothetical protein [Deltaproteobacteria bacterium]
MARRAGCWLLIPFWSLGALLLAACPGAPRPDGKPKAQISERDAALSALGESRQKILGMKAQARKTGDLVAQSCMDERIAAIEGLQRIVESCSEGGQGDAEAREQTIAKIRIARGKAPALVSEARACLNQAGDVPLGQTRVQIEVDPDSPTDGPKLSEDPLIRGFHLMFRVRTKKSSTGQTGAILVFRNQVEAPDSLAGLHIALDETTCTQESPHDRAVLDAGADREVFRAPIPAGTHRVICRIEYRCARAEKRFRLRASSGQDIEMAAGKTTLVEIIATLTDRPLPPKVPFETLEKAGGGGGGEER